MAECEFCEGKGHIQNLDTGLWMRCVCLQENLKKQALGIFYTPNPAKKTTLGGLTTTNTLIEMPLQALRPHMARVMLDLQETGKTILVLDAYRLIEIFLEKDEEFETNYDLTDCDLLVVMMGFGDPRNKYLPELILQVLGRREVMRQPTWVVLGMDAQEVGMKYGMPVAERLATFRMVRMRE